MAVQKGAKKAATATRRRRERKNVDRGAAHIQSTFNLSLIHIFSAVKKDIARVKTILRENEIKDSANA